MNTSQIKSNISQNLKTARQKSSLTQDEVAKQAGTNTNYYAKIERGESMPSIKMLARITKALKAKSSDILPF